MACGFGYLASIGMAQQEAVASRSPLLPAGPHFTPRAKRVIFLFMQGGPSHVDTFDYNRYLLIYNLGPEAAPFGKAVLQIVLNSHGDFVDEMIAEEAGQKG